MASITGIAASTLRACASSGRADLPLLRPSSAAAPCGPALLPTNGPRPASATPTLSASPSPSPAPTAAWSPSARPSSPPTSSDRSTPPYGTTDRSATDGGSAGATPRTVREVAGSLAASTASYILCSLIPSQDLILTVAKAALWELRA